MEPEAGVTEGPWRQHWSIQRGVNKLLMRLIMRLWRQRSSSSPQCPICSLSVLSVPSVLCLPSVSNLFSVCPLCPICSLSVPCVLPVTQCPLSCVDFWFPTWSWLLCCLCSSCSALGAEVLRRLIPNRPVAILHLSGVDHWRLQSSVRWVKNTQLRLFFLLYFFINSLCISAVSVSTKNFHV